MNRYAKNLMMMSRDGGRGRYAGEMEYRGDYRRSRDYGYDHRDMRDYDYDRRDYRDYADERRDYGDRRDWRMYDRYDRAEGGDMEEGKLTPDELREWQEGLKNADKSHGPHFHMESMRQHLEQNGATEMATPEEALATANMLYSDYCKALSQVVTPSNEAAVYARMARAFLSDPDSSCKGSEKLCLYRRITEDDE